MKKLIIYIHGKGGNIEEACHFKPLFKNCDVIGLDYSSQNPWDACIEFPKLFDDASINYNSIEIICNSIGAFFAMNALNKKNIARAYFISPIVDMEKLINDMLSWANCTLDDLKKKKEIKTSFGETLSWDYLCYVKSHVIKWDIPTNILYGRNDNLTSYETISSFSKKINATLTIMEDGGHWFHTPKELEFLDNWITNKNNKLI